MDATSIIEHVTKVLADDEDESLLNLSELSGYELLEIQLLADKITLQIATVLLAREMLSAERETNGDQDEIPSV